jgi:phosphate transport system substrate-binding protein
MAIAGALVSWALLPGSTACAQETLRYSCSAQVYEAFEKERLDVFTKQSGIKIDLFIASSSSAVNRLMYGVSEIASTARGLYYPLVESGYVETPFCRDPLAIIVNAQCPVDDLSEDQLTQIFSGAIKNWKEVGGPDKELVVVIPAKNTAAYENFERQAMRRKEITYDYLSYKSTGVIELVKRLPSAVSFVAHGAAMNQEGVKHLKVGGLTCTDKNFPFYQEFSFVTKGKPSGSAKAFIDHAFSDMGKDIMTKKGMVPVSRPQ